MDRTHILLPLALEDEQRDSEKFKRPRELLAQLEQKDVSMRGATFKVFLEHLNMSYEEYLLALRSGINRPTVVLKRTVDETGVSNENDKISREYLKKLDSNNRDVYELNIIDRYVVRPDKLENECLASFAAWYELAKVGLEDMKLLKGNQYVRHRTKPNLIQYRKFKESQDENEYYREQVMLFTNWRNENADILIQDFKQLYTTNLEIIRINRKEFVTDENLDLEEELMQLEKSRALEENEEKSEERSLVTFEPVLDYDENDLVGNISLDMNNSHGKGFSVFQPTNKYPDDKYRELV
ncbi:ATP-dependent DNA helicase [Trichonephila inaurata madagascariensis]|uniref:ATP-dependent DNA helicase n=1 Tax=Trichonephila inaurata madagascariensis TaxID=2747483 RepID=A0A8X6YEH5_9ARAC|nr:ATP-dependent DNA helicase [Trichonephila inaurata madagascariensis]